MIRALSTGLFILLFICFASVAVAEIYSWTDEKGVTHYSTSRDSKEAVPAELPSIMKADIVIPEVRQASCDDHGGVDCSAGPAGDGSVICRDGYRGVRTPFRFACNSTRLQIADITEIDENGQFNVFVRNLESVEAQQVAVQYVPESGERITLEGPANLEGFAMGEFLYRGSDYVPLLRQPESSQIIVSCLNC